MLSTHRQLVLCATAAVLVSWCFSSCAQEQPDAKSLPSHVQGPSGPVIVTYEGGQLTIQALNVPLTRLLDAVSRQIGTIIDVPAGAYEAVVGEFGPGRPAAVLAALLNGSHFNYVMTASQADPDRLERVILTVRTDKRGQEATATPTSDTRAAVVSAAKDSAGVLDVEQLRSQVNDLLAQAGAQQTDAGNVEDGYGMQQLRAVMEATLARATALAAIDKAIEANTPRGEPDAGSAPPDGPGSDPNRKTLPATKLTRRRR